LGRLTLITLVALVALVVLVALLPLMLLLVLALRPPLALTRLLPTIHPRDPARTHSAQNRIQPKLFVPADADKALYSAVEPPSMPCRPHHLRRYDLTNDLPHKMKHLLVVALLLQHVK
jgi:hypothetical protein